MSGLIVGSLAPGFAAQSYDGRHIALERYLTHSHVLLILLRGLKCPQCRRHLVQMGRAYERLVEHDVEVIAVGPDPPSSFGDFFGSHRLTFPGIPDNDHTVGASYGASRSWWRRRCRPAQFFIERRSGVIRFVEYGRCMGRMTAPGEFLAVAARI